MPTICQCLMESKIGYVFITCVTHTSHDGKQLCKFSFDVGWIVFKLSCAQNFWKNNGGTAGE